MRKLVTVISALVITLAVASPAFAYGLEGGKQPSSIAGGNLHTYCYDTTHPLPTAMHNVAEVALHTWDNLGNAYFAWTITSHQEHPTCQWKLSWYPLGSGGPVAVTGYNIDSSGYLRNVGTDFNSNHPWYVSSQVDLYCSTQDANHQPALLPGATHACLSDFYTSVIHEAGHALGLAHNIIPDQTYTLCKAGFYATQVVSACTNAPTNLDAYARADMYWLAADGYRRSQTGDDIAGIQRIYGICCS